QAAYGPALEMARTLVEGRDYVCHTDERRIDLTAAGRRRVEALAKPLGGPWQATVRREEWVLQALTADKLFHRDEHYIVRDGKVEIVDEYTGRVMADRFWSDGLHQMIEMKEGCEPTGMRVTLARMTYQRFFRRYRRLAGMSGTLSEVAGELWKVYRLRVARIPQNRPSQRRELPGRVVRTDAQKWREIASTTAALAEKGVPVLIGTRSVAASLKASEQLAAIGLDHVVLNAAQDEAEADIVAQAGESGRITVATNMAGRGTDIKLGDPVCALGGLHVIMSDLHDSRRIDRQLAGRCARQGQPGVHLAVLSGEDALLDMDPIGFSRLLVRLGLATGSRRIGRLALRSAQWQAERLHSGMRRALLNSDEIIDHALAFAGKPE
ncbi:MAG: prepilin peptidase, partial [Rhodobiaceae bacterium]|nr:prepilin peptidase [Rhodobiaceae bacterium]